MFSHLTKTVTAGVLAVALSLAGITATATPAAANGHRNQGAEAAAILGGILLLYGLSQANRNNQVTRLNQFPPPPPPPIYHPQPRQHYRIAPTQCFIEGHDHTGYYHGYLARCTEQSVWNPHLLPAECLRTVWTNHGQRRIYGGNCMARNGWTRG
jgi:hypothetical protein